MMRAMQNHVAELTFASGRAYADLFDEVTLDAVITDPHEREIRPPSGTASSAGACAAPRGDP